MWNNLKNIVLFFLVSIALICSSFIELNSKKVNKVRKIVIDAGHGGKDPGCKGKSAKEAEVALKVALVLGNKIKSEMRDVQIIFTRDEDEFIELHDRAGIANKNNADLFLSVHCNAAASHVFGSESYTMGLHTSEGNLEVAKRENSVILQEDDYMSKYNGYDPNSPISHILMANYQNAYITKSIELASYIEDEMKQETKRHSRGVKQAGFLVLWKTIMPSVLVEIGYLTNEDEEKYLRKEENQEEVADAILQALKKYKSKIEASN